MVDTVNTSALREHANSSSCGYVYLNTEEVVAIADEITSLRAQLAEAKAAAIPWRKGPAMGGEMPEVRRQIVIESEFNFFEVGFFHRYDTGRTVFRTPNGAESGRTVRRYFYPSDLIAVAAAKGADQPKPEPESDCDCGREAAELIWGGRDNCYRCGECGNVIYAKARAEHGRA